MLEKEFHYYIDNQQSLVNIYNKRYIVIVGEEVVGSYDIMEDAYFSSLKKYNEGTFLIQLCSEGIESYTQTFHSNVNF